MHFEFPAAIVVIPYPELADFHDRFRQLGSDLRAERISLAIAGRQEHPVQAEHERRIAVQRDAARHGLCIDPDGESISSDVAVEHGVVDGELVENDPAHAKAAQLERHERGPGRLSPHQERLPRAQNPRSPQ